MTPTFRTRRKRFLRSVPHTLLRGLPEADQDAIRAAVRRPVTMVGRDALGRAEVQWTAPDNSIHTIWVDDRHLGG